MRRSNAGIDELIGAIYDCVIDPTRWYGVVDRMRNRYNFHNGILGVNSAIDSDVIMHVAVGIPDEMLPVVQKYGLDVLELWGGWARISAAPLEEPLLQSEQTERASWASNNYYRHFIAPQGLNDALAIGLARDPLTVATVAFGRHASAPPLSEAELDEMRIVAPHLRRAVVIGRLLESAMGTAATFADALDATAVGVVLVDRACRVVHANRAAALMLAAGDPIRANAGQLEIATELVPGALARAIETASEAAAGSKGVGVPTRRLDGQPLTLQVMPLDRRTGSNTPAAAVAAVFVAEAAGGPATSSEVLALLFDLTPAESRIFALIVNGMEIPEIGAQLSITPTTAKSHLGRIYQKTGQSSRAGLVRLAQGIAPPV